MMRDQALSQQGGGAVTGSRGLSLLLLAMAVFILAPHARGADRQDPNAPVPDACGVLSNDDLTGLLLDQAGGALDSWSSRTDASLSGCDWEGRPRQQPLDTPPRKASLQIYQYDDDAQAQAQLAAYAGAPSTASDALTPGDDDAVAHRSATVVVARHEAKVALLDASGAELKDPGQREPHYPLDALALKAADAKVRPRTWTFAGASPTSDWTPPRRSMAPWTILLQPLLAALALAASWRFYLIVAFVLGAMAVGLSRSKRKAQPAPPPNARRGRWSLGAVGAAAFALLFLNVLAGPFLSAFLLYHLGQSGAAAVTGSHATATQYNNHSVVAYDVLLRTVDGRLVKTGFRDDDFNVFPGGNTVSYPDEGTVFTARYLPLFPSRFVIVADDASPWASRQRCDALRDAADQQRTKLRLAADDRGLQAAVDRADARFRAAGCASGQD